MYTSKNTISSILNFIIPIYRLKNIPRTGWYKKIGVKNPESIGDHIFMTSILCMLIGDIKQLDTLKMIKIALLHDIGESLIGDLISYEDTDSSKRKLENLAIKQLFSKLPDDFRKQYLELWNDYQNRTSKEGKLVWEIDKLEMAFQAFVYEKEGYDKSRISEFFKTAIGAIDDDEIKSILNEIINLSHLDWDI